MIDPATAAIKFALDSSTDDPMSFLRCWYEGDFESIRNEWPEAPEEVFLGADPLWGPYNGGHTPRSEAESG